MPRPAWWHLRDLLAAAPRRAARRARPDRPRRTRSGGPPRSCPASSRSPRTTGLPLRLLELGASAGLNLRADRYWYEQDGVGWGDPASAVRFVDLWPDATPPLGTPATIASRAGCDRDPIDATRPDAALTLLVVRLAGPGTSGCERMRAALDIAAGFPVDVAQAAIEEWLPAQLAAPVPGVATVVFHSVVWQYLPEPTRALVLATLERCRGAARPGRAARLPPARADAGDLLPRRAPAHPVARGPRRRSARPPASRRAASTSVR